MIMTPDQLTVLTSELHGDPKTKGYAAHLPDDPQRVIELLTVQDDTMVGPLRSTTAKAWAAKGPYARIYDASLNASHLCRASCLVIRDSFSCGDMIHLEMQEMQDLLTAWVSTNVATQAEVDDLYRLATVPASRIEVLGIPTPSARDIIDAWSNT